MAITIRSRKVKAKRLEKLIRDKIIEAFNLTSDDVRITIGQEGGMDIKLSTRAKARFPFAVEAKARATFNTLYNFLDQAKKHDAKLIPLVVVKGDRKQPLAILDFDYFITLVSK